MEILSTGFDCFDDEFNKVFEIREWDDGLSVQIIKYIETEDEWDDISCAVKKCITTMNVRKKDNDGERYDKFQLKEGSTK